MVRTIDGGREGWQRYPTRVGNAISHATLCNDICMPNPSCAPIKRIPLKSRNNCDKPTSVPVQRPGRKIEHRKVVLTVKFYISTSIEVPLQSDQRRFASRSETNLRQPDLHARTHARTPGKGVHHGHHITRLGAINHSLARTNARLTSVDPLLIK